MENFKRVKTHIDNIVVGDVIEHNGNIQTVGRNNIKYDPFVGRSLFGDCYHLGYKPVIKLIYIKPAKMNA